MSAIGNATGARPPASLGRRAALLALAALGFAATCALVRMLVPWPEEYGLRAKYEHIRAHKDEYDALFIGSSRTFRGIDPRIVDAELASQGIPFRSYNLGVGGMGAFEMDFLLDAVLALHPAKLRWIFLESDDWGPAQYFLGNTFSSRSIFWHDGRRTLAALRSVEIADEPLMEKLALAWTHMELLVMQWTSYGQGKRVVLDLLGQSRDPLGRALSEEALEEGRGYQALDDLVPGEATSARKALLDDPDGFRKMVDKIRSENAREVKLARYNFAALHRQYAAARAAGAELLVIVPPSHEPSPLPRRLHEQGEIPVLFDFNDPDRYPELFREDRRFDVMHLNRPGALAFSRLVAQAFREHLRRKP
jgi:hypothetical protein